MQTTPALSTEKEETSPISVVAVNTTTDVTARTNSSTSADIGNEQVGATLKQSNMEDDNKILPENNSSDGSSLPPLVNSSAVSSSTDTTTTLLASAASSAALPVEMKPQHSMDIEDDSIVHKKESQGIVENEMVGENAVVVSEKPDEDNLMQCDTSPSSEQEQAVSADAGRGDKASRECDTTLTLAKSSDSTESSEENAKGNQYKKVISKVESAQVSEEVEVMLITNSDKTLLGAETSINGENNKPTEKNTDTITEDIIEVESDDEYDGPSALSDIYEEFSSTERVGSTCTGGPASNLPSAPGLRIEGIGTIPLPLTSIYASKIRETVAVQAPHGRGMETVIDKSVRDTLQVEPNKVEISNPAWETSLKELVHKASEVLGVNPNLVRCELYKLLLYEPGGFFKKHRDTEKSDGMFATLVVQLPSEFTGAKFIVTHNNDTRKFDMEEDCNYQCKYVAHYADCQHEIKPLESGYRLAIIYSLCYTGPESSKPTALSLAGNNLARLLKALPRGDSLFSIPLEHQYTEASLSRLGVGALKGQDRVKHHSIASAGGMEWEFLLCNVTRTDSEYGSGDGYYYCNFDVHDTEKGTPDISRNKIFRSDGSLANDVPWLESQLDFDSVEAGGNFFVNEDDLDEVWGDGDEGSVEYTGNEGATRETTYSMYILVAYSKDSAFERLCLSDFNSALRKVINDRTLLPRFLAFMTTKSPRLTCEQGYSILEILKLDEEKEGNVKKNLNIVLKSIAIDSLPSRCFTDSLLKIVEKYGWNETTAGIKTLFTQRLIGAKSLTCCKLIELVGVYLQFLRLPGSSFVEESMKDFVKNFSNTSKSNSWSYSTYSGESLTTLGEPLVKIGKAFGWDQIKDTANACIDRIEKRNYVNNYGARHSGNMSSSMLVQRVELYDTIIAGLPDAATFFAESKNKIVEEVVKNIVSSNFNYEDSLLKLLLKNGSDDQHQRVLESIKKLCHERSLNLWHRLFQRISVSTEKDIALKSRFVSTINTQTKQIKINDLMKRRKTLILSTREEIPTFSWQFSKARHTNHSIQTFLRGSNSSERIFLGNGIANARSVVYQLTRSSQKGTEGYSVTASSGGTGKHAYINISKTRMYYDTIQRKRQRDLQDLRNIESQLRTYSPNIILSTPTSSEYDTILPVVEGSLLLLIGQGRDNSVLFNGYRSLPGNRKSQAESQNLVRGIGDRLVGINGKTVQGKSYDEVLQMIREQCTKEKEIEMRFSRSTGSNSSSAVRGASEPSNNNTRQSASTSNSTASNGKNNKNSSNRADDIEVVNVMTFEESINKRMLESEVIDIDSVTCSSPNKRAKKSKNPHPQSRNSNNRNDDDVIVIE